MKAIYTRTIKVKDDMLGKAMEIGKGLAKVRKKYFPKHQIYFSFQVGGNPRTIRETVIGPMFEGDNQGDAKMSADKKYQSLQKQLKKVAVEGTIEDEMRFIFSEINLKINKCSLKEIISQFMSAKKHIIHN